MKSVTFLSVFVLLFSSCTHEMPVHERADMPGDTEPWPEAEAKAKPKKQRMGTPSSDVLTLIFVVAAVAAAAKALSAAERGDCGDCRGDGIVHHGDPRSVRLTIWVYRAYRCPLCDGDGHL